MNIESFIIHIFYIIGIFISGFILGFYHNQKFFKISSSIKHTNKVNYQKPEDIIK